VDKYREGKLKKRLWKEGQNNLKSLKGYPDRDRALGVMDPGVVIGLWG
jgi:hypothetical protein